jgi:integrative and conjugative element protein (TIGR02256 family)
MESLASAKYPLETGGVLIGYTGGPGGDEVVVAAITGPGPRARHAATAFEPDHEYQTGEIARIYRASGGVNTYLGDWHTHPAAAPDLSRRDKKTLTRIASHREARLDRPVMAILGESSQWTLKVWRLFPGSLIALRRVRYCDMDIREMV